MRKLNNFQQQLWERHLRALDVRRTALAEADRQKEVAADQGREARLCAELLWRDGVDVEKLAAAVAAEQQAAEAEESSEGQANGFNKTHAIIDVFQRFGDAGFGPTELWQKAVEVYPDGNISRAYVNTVIGKLQAPPREFVEKNGNGKYHLTEKGRLFTVDVGV